MSLDFIHLTTDARSRACREAVQHMSRFGSRRAVCLYDSGKFNGRFKWSPGPQMQLLEGSISVLII